MNTDIFGFQKGRSVHMLRVRIVISISVFLVLSAVMLYDTFNVKSFITLRTEKFAQDLTFQHASNISKEFLVRILNMKMIADSLVQEENINSEFQLSDFVQRKTDLSLFNDLFFVDIDDIPDTDNLSVMNANGYDINLNHIHLLHSLDKTEHACIHYNEQNSEGGKSNYLYYIQQVVRDGKILGALVGIRSRNALQDFIQLQALNNETVSCIVNKEAQMVVGATNKHLPSYRSLDSFVLFQDTEENHHAVQKIRDSIGKLEPGIQMVTSSSNGDNLLVTYNPLGINDWGLLTFIPEDLVAFDSTAQSTRNFVISIIAIFIFGFITISSAYTFTKNKQQMERIAFYDPITDGLNREGFTLRFQEIVETGKPNNYAIAMINMRHFKLINEQFGKEKGDKALKHILYSIEKCLHSNEFVARYSADRFFICFKEQDFHVIETRLHQIVSEINAFNTGVSNPYYMEFNCGVELVENKQSELSRIQDHIQIAYDVAVEENIFCVFYQKTLTEKLLRNQELDRLFEPSLKNGDFRLYLQPKVHLETGLVCGAEALVRWHHPQKGKILPSDFIPLFEANGKICQLDLHMFTEVCKTMRRWQLEGRQLFPISFNLSRQHYFHNPEFLEAFAQVARDYQIPAGLLDFELTESIFFESDKFIAVKKSLNEMHQLGFLCSLDDFGVGFSSLGLLKEFDIDTIKFDRQFFLDVSTDKAKTIVESLMSMSEKLGIKTVAEGIETTEQLIYLNGTPCDIIQGYIFSMPLSVDDFEEWIDSLDNRKVSFE